MTAADSRTSLRQSLRERRRRIPEASREAAADRLRRRVVEQGFFTEAQTIAFYSAIDGEIDPHPLLEAALRGGKRCYLPIVVETPPSAASEQGSQPAPAQSDRPADAGPLLFAPAGEAADREKNRWGISEPPAENLLAPDGLDLVLVPLVGFDAGCNRLGMGKGFYDRTFAFKRGSPESRPYLAGLAYECQLVEAVSAAAHDVPLDAVVTERRIRFRRISGEKPI